MCKNLLSADDLKKMIMLDPQPAPSSLERIYRIAWVVVPTHGCNRAVPLDD